MDAVVPFGSSKQKALAILPWISGFASCCASVWIIVEVVTTRDKLRTTYNRLLLTMSIVDVASSIGHMLGPLPAPEEYDDVIAWATGNESTCAAQGFLVQLSIVVAIYQLCLSVYYLLLVRFGATQDDIAKYAEPLMHVAALLVGFGTAFASLGRGIFTSTNLWCWITPFPHSWQMFLFYVPLWISMILVLGINTWIYVTVRKREKQAEKLHADHQEKHERPRLYDKTRMTSVRLAPTRASHTSARRSLQSFSTRRSLTSGRMSTQKSRVSFTFGHDPSNIFFDSHSTLEHKSRKDESSTPALDRIDESSVNEEDQEHIDSPASEVQELQSEKNDSKAISTKTTSEPSRKSFGLRLTEIFTHHHTTDEPSLTFTKDGDNEQGPDNIFRASLGSISTMVLPERAAKRFSRKLSKRQSSVSARNSQVDFVLATVEEYPSAAKQYAATYQIGARLIFYQSMAYVLGFWVIWICSTVNEILLLVGSQQLFWILLLRAFLEPLQGVFNFSVYRFAHFLRLKELNPNWSTAKLIRHTTRWTFSRKRSRFKKASRESIERSNSNRKSSEVINSARVNEDGDLHSDNISEPDSESDSSAELDETNNATDTDSSNTRVLYRMSSMLGDLMAEFTDYPDTLNQDYKEVVGENLFSYPVSSFPTVYDGQSFSDGPSSFPNIVPMSHFPVNH